MAIHERMEQCINEVTHVSNRIISITLNAKQPIALIGVYGPTAVASNAEKDRFYEQLTETYKKLRNKRNASGND